MDFYLHAMKDVLPRIQRRLFHVLKFVANIDRNFKRCQQILNHNYDYHILKIYIISSRIFIFVL